MKTLLNTKTSVLRENISEKVCLIIPPSPFLLDERVFMSLGILKVAAVLEQAGIDVDVLDLSGIRNFPDVISDYVRTRTDTILFGITSTTPQLPATTKIARTIRCLRPYARIIIGGPHVTLVNAAFKKERLIGRNERATTAMEQLETCFDILVAGDGEEAVFVALGENPPKLIDADIVNSPLFLDNEHLTELPFPARHLIDEKSYHYSIDDVPALSLIAQLGCPFACGFCGGRESPSLRKIRMRTSENVVAEMIHIYRTTGKRGFMLYDDELNVNKNMVPLMHLIAKTQRDLGVTWRLRGFIKSQLLTDEQANAMYEAGFRWILVGFESGSPAILKAINKRATRDDNSHCMEIARHHGLKIKALMSIGHPGENLATIEQTRDWLIEAKPDDFDVSLITCYPGTPYYDQALLLKDRDGLWVYTYPNTGAKLYQYAVDFMETANYYKGDPDGGYKAYVFTEELSSDDLVFQRDRLEREVRSILGIPFNPSAKAVLYEHSMGQWGKLPHNILRTKD